MGFKIMVVFYTFKYINMHIQVNGSVGDSVNHSMFGNGIITEIADNYVAIDFPEKKGFKAAKWRHKGITVGSQQLIDLVFDGPKGNYEIEFEFTGAIYNPNTTNPIHDRSLTFDNMTEAEAAELCRERVTSYGNYDGGFFINKVTKLEPAV